MEDRLTRAILFKARALGIFSMAAFGTDPAGHVRRLQDDLIGRGIELKASGNTVLEFSVSPRSR